MARDSSSAVADPVESSLADRLLALPRFYSYKDVLTDVFGGDEDAFVDAWCDGSLPPEVRGAITDTMASTVMQMYLQRRQIRQTNLLIALLEKGLGRG